MAMIYVEYEALSMNYKGWTLSEQKHMPHRERHYWLSMLKYRALARSQGQ